MPGTMMRGVAGAACVAALWLAACERPFQSFNRVVVTVLSPQDAVLHEAEVPVENPAAFDALVDGAVEKRGQGALIHAMHSYHLKSPRGGEASGKYDVFAMRITQLEGGTWVAVDVMQRFKILEKGDIALMAPTLDELKPQMAAAMRHIFERPHQFEVWRD